MKATAVVTAATATLLALAGCANMKPQSTTVATASSGTYYCWQDKLYDAGPNLVCNWERSLSDACRAKDDVSIPKSSVTEAPRKTHRCENGQWLVTVNAR